MEVVAVNSAVIKSVHWPLADEMGSVSKRAPIRIAPIKLKGISLIEDILVSFMSENLLKLMYVLTLKSQKKAYTLLNRIA